MIMTPPQWDHTNPLILRSDYLSDLQPQRCRGCPNQPSPFISKSTALVKPSNHLSKKALTAELNAIAIRACQFTHFGWAYKPPRMCGDKKLCAEPSHVPRPAMPYRYVLSKKTH